MVQEIILKKMLCSKLRRISGNPKEDTNSALSHTTPAEEEADRYINKEELDRREEEYRETESERLQSELQQNLQEDPLYNLCKALGLCQ